jgi:hypothetical protein
MAAFFVYDNIYIENRNMRRNIKNDFMRTLNEAKKYLSEAYVFDDEFSDSPEMGGGDEMPYDEREMRGGHDDMERGDSVEEKEMHANEVIRHEPIIGKIRETAIEGLKKYSDSPTSSLYEFFKKVFLESDKVLTDTGNKD